MFMDVLALKVCGDWVIQVMVIPKVANGLA